MNRRKWIPLAIVVAGALVLAVAAFGGARARTATEIGQVPHERAARVAAALPAEQSSGRPGDAIQVHGHWTIQVMNADGSVADRVEFENGFVGAAALSALLAHQHSIGLWGVFVGDGLPGGTSPCFAPVTAAVRGCYISEPGSVFTTFKLGTFSPPNFQTLTVSAPTTGANMSSLVLSGFFTAERDGSITMVDTFLKICGPFATAASPCGATTDAETGITDKFLAAGSATPPIPVIGGQQIQVTVVISFQ